MKLVGVARASLEELLLDYIDFLRQKKLPQWDKDNSKARKIRSICHRKDRSYSSYKTYIEDLSAEIAANTIICLIHQTNYLLDRQLRALEQAFLEEGGFSERLYRARSHIRKRQSKR